VHAVAALPGNTVDWVADRSAYAKLKSAALFHKRTDNFVTTETLLNQGVGVVSPDSALDSWTINRHVNAGG
jgi:hypothetical protein